MRDEGRPARCTVAACTAPISSANALFFFLPASPFFAMRRIITRRALRSIRVHSFGGLGAGCVHRWLAARRVWCVVGGDVKKKVAGG
jgi:hypothetical protein